MLRGKVLFGTDYPLITPERWLDDFAGLEIRAEATPGILTGNAC
jgi:predicted TIM-barrel fold metal-dependent hydrolase